MYFKLLKNDLKKNPWNNLILMLFMTLSIVVSVSVVLMLNQLFTSISDMYESAKPPHFLQMHKGELEQGKIDAFNESYPGMEYWQTVPMIDVYGEELSIHRNGEKVFTLEDCRLDISLVKQNDEYDVLLDENREKLKVAEGEIGVPVILLSQYQISVGDELTFQSKNVEKTFKVSGYVYDGQMNSTLCSSTRFLISDGDFDELLGTVGETEYLIEAYFEDKSEAGAYQSAYEENENNLPKNGQAVTYNMIFLLSAMTDIMTAMIFYIVGILLIAIALFCLKYTMMAAIEQDVREIGTMKAMGIPADGIRNLYLWKIRGIMLISCVLGTGLAYVAMNFMTNHISATFGKQEIRVGSFFVAALVCVVVYGLVILFTKRVLGKVRSAKVVDLLLFEKGFQRERKRGGGYGIIVSLMVIVTFFVMLPYQIVNTMEDEKFVTYMGSAVCDMLLEVEQGAELEARKAAAESVLSEQENDINYTMTKRVRVQTMNSEKEPVSVHIDCGEKAGAELQYIKGNGPQNENEIAVSTLVAEQLGREQGETVELLWNGKRSEFVISGIYQDVTSGGKTVKAICDFEGEQAEQYTFYVDFEEEVFRLDADGADKGSSIAEEKARIERFREMLGKGYSIENMDEFIAQTLGGVTAQVEQGGNVAMMIGILLIALIVMLYMQLRIAQEGKMFAEKKAIGIPFFAICMQELKPMIAAGGIGVVVGMVVCSMLGDDIVSMLVGSMGLGIERIKFSGLSIGIQAGILMLLVTVLIVVTLAACVSVKKLKIMDYINE